MRAVGIDFGERRIGFALSDSEGKVALPYDKIVRTKDQQGDWRRIVSLINEAEAECVVVGIPLSLDGTANKAAKRIEGYVAQLKSLIDLPIHYYDERFSTVEAERSLKAMNLDGRARRQVVDQVAAAVILQGWLDQQADRSDPNGSEID